MSKAKQQAARAALNAIRERFHPNEVIGIGTGSTVEFFIDLLAEHKGEFAGGTATSVATALRLKERGIPVFDLNDVAVKVYIDGADESDSQLRLIKGGHGALTLEKINAAAAETFICIVDESKFVDQLGKTPLPVEVIAQSRTHVCRQLEKMGGQPSLEEGFLTDHGNPLLRVSGLDFTDPATLESQINDMAGVVCCGIFAHRPADILYLGHEEGCREITSP